MRKKYTNFSKAIVVEGKVNSIPTSTSLVTNRRNFFSFFLHIVHRKFNYNFFICSKYFFTKKILPVPYKKGRRTHICLTIVLITFNTSMYCFLCLQNMKYKFVVFFFIFNIFINLVDIFL